MTMAIGYVGLGNMGGALARRLLQRQALLVCDRQDQAVRDIAACGATPCASLHDLATRCDVIMLCLPSSAIVRCVIFGEGGLASAARPGTLLIDQTSGDPEETRAMAADLATRGMDLIDAPVSGGPQAALDGRIAIMVGASPDQFARAEPILLTIGPKVFHVGNVGAGHVVKLANNLVSATNRAAALEALAIAARNGIKPRKALEVMLAGSARNFWLEALPGSGLLDGDVTSGFTLEVIHKDLCAAARLAEASHVPMPIGAVVRDFYALCIAHLGPAAEGNAAALVVERNAAARMFGCFSD
jgi:3-hydroxyisobutyrate dehydrogenase